MVKGECRVMETVFYDDVTPTGLFRAFKSRTNLFKTSIYATTKFHNVGLIYSANKVSCPAKMGANDGLEPLARSPMVVPIAVHQGKQSRHPRNVPHGFCVCLSASAG